MDQSIKYIAEIRQVREVALHGSADLRYWSERLTGEGFSPVAQQNKAQILVTGVAAKWMGVAFCELSIGVLVRAEWNGGHEDGILLLHAFNSSRLFAFCERRCFQTPYVHSDVRLHADLPVSIEARTKDRPLLTAEMQNNAQREPMGSAHESWEGPIFLPRRSSQGRERHRLFWAKLEGVTATFRFTAPDTAHFYPDQAHPALGWLADSGFTGERWTVRQAATHARSKTLTKKSDG